MNQLTNEQIAQIDALKENPKAIKYVSVSDEPKLHATYSDLLGYKLVIFAATPYEATILIEVGCIFDFANRCNRALIDLTGSCSEVVEPDISQHQTILIKWCTDDVLSVDDSLTIEQANEVLEFAKSKHDATIGINWDVLNCHIDTLRHKGVIS